RTITYRVKVNPDMWPYFFSKKPLEQFSGSFDDSGESIDPKDDNSLIHLQQCLESGQGPYFLSSQEILMKDVGDPLSLYSPKGLT
ncbi:MAG: hypothetical protein MJK18_14645, partial [Bdellovibrionales bacterium]|nr:hypothetical protein [Bdellovibrionales bacterium]